MTMHVGERIARWEGLNNGFAGWQRLRHRFARPTQSE